MRIQVPQNDNYVEQVERTHANADKCMPCAICGRKIDLDKCNATPVKWLRLDASWMAYKDEEPESSEDMGCYPVGYNCLHKYPELKPFTL